MKNTVKILGYVFLAACLMAAKPNLGGFRPQQVCQAGLASLQGSQLREVAVYRSQQQLMQFRVSKAGKTDSYICQLDGDTVRWRRAQDSQWQTRPMLRYHFNRSGKQLFITHYLGEARLAEYRYRVEDF